MRQLPQRAIDAAARRFNRWASPGVPIESLLSLESDSAAVSAELVLRSVRAVSAIDLVTGYLDNRFVLGGYDETGAHHFRWCTTPERAVITRATGRMPRDVRRRLDRAEFDIVFDVELRAILEGCREGRDSWLTDELIDLYVELDDLGFMSTVATYRDGDLVGGYAGIRVGGCFAGLSRFHRAPGAGSVAYGALVAALLDGTGPSMIDSGPMSDHVARFGAIARDPEVHRRAVLEGLAARGRRSSGDGPE
ncbi:MAG: hypothetical protein KDB37_00235 [Ilumatobacter sp.]|nr:hypothetical protein [Ilumatobacter sp.]